MLYSLIGRKIDSHPTPVRSPASEEESGSRKMFLTVENRTVRKTGKQQVAFLSGKR
jgi:hypothetical protein